MVALLRRRFFRSQFSYIIYAQFFGGIGFFNKEDSTRKGGTVQVRTSERINHSSRMKIPSSHRAAVAPGEARYDSPEAVSCGVPPKKSARGGEYG